MPDLTPLVWLSIAALLGLALVLACFARRSSNDSDALHFARGGRWWRP